MKHLILASLVAVATLNGAFAQNVIYNPVNNATVGPPNLWPFSTYPEWRFSFIIDAKILGSSPFRITDIAFAPSSTATWTAKDFQIRMNHTTLSGYSAVTPPAFDTVIGSAPTVVYDGPISWTTTANTWSPIGLTRSFGYDGARNVCCEIRYKARGPVNLQVRVYSGIKRAYTNNRYSSNPYDDPLWYSPIPGENSGPRHRLTYESTNVLIADDAVGLGRSAGIRVINGTNPGDRIQVATSLGQAPLNLRNSCSIHLDADHVFFASLTGLQPTVFDDYAGTVDNGGGYTARFSPPALNLLVGLSVYHAAIIYDGNGIRGCTNTAGTLITR